MSAELSEKAIDCFVHGLAHLMCELGPERGLNRATRIIEVLVATDPVQFLAGRQVAFPDLAESPVH